MSKTVTEVINFLWANNARGGVDIDGLYGKQCVDLPKAVMQFCGEPTWNKARGDAMDVINNLVADGVATWQPTTQSRIRVVSGTGGLFDPTYGHIWIEVDQTIFSQNPTQTRAVGSYGAFNNKKVAYLKCITADKAPTPAVTYIGTSAHVQSIGWKNYAQTIGTTGKAKRLEAVTMPAGVEGEGHIQSLGWTSRRKSGEVIGTVGSSKRLEAIKLYGKIKYRVHVQGQGWTGWCTSGQVAGTTGKGLRLEAVEIIKA